MLMIIDILTFEDTNINCITVLTCGNAFIQLNYADNMMVHVCNTDMKLIDS